MFAEISFDFTRITNNTVIIAVVGYIVVFTALVTSYFLFNNLPYVLKINPKRFFEKRREAREQKNGEQEVKEISGEVNAAISMALHLCMEDEHDEEDMVLTLKKVSKRYSPWSSKIYTVMNLRHSNRL